MSDSQAQETPKAGCSEGASKPEIEDSDADSSDSEGFEVDEDEFDHIWKLMGEKRV